MLTCNPFAFALYTGAKHNKQAQLTLSEHCNFRYLLKTLLLYFKYVIISLTLGNPFVNPDFATPSPLKPHPVELCRVMK